MDRPGQNTRLSQPSSSSPFNPPPLPPRPPKAATIPRKPVPSVDPSSTLLSAQIPPLLPPRPRSLVANPFETEEQTYGVLPSNPEPPARSHPDTIHGVLVDEKSREILRQRSRRDDQGRGGHRRWPRSRTGRICAWISILALLVIIVVVVVAVTVTTIRHNKGKGSASSSTTSSKDNGGHPLPVSEGGVSIGQPGDIPTYGANSTDHFLLKTYRSSVVTRLDPIVNPGTVGSHVHRVFGSSYFTSNLTSVSEAQARANCTTAPVQDDKSAYWVAQVYYRYPNGSLVAVPVIYTSVYYFLKAPTGVEIYPFPDNYNIVAGNPYRRYLNESDPNNGALWWQCYRGQGNDDRYDGFPNTACEGGLDQGIQFPSCWDGVYAEDADYAIHVAYPEDSTNGFHCPSAFPKKFITVQFETTFNVNMFPFNGADEITWVLANGDTSGYGIHGDFMNGWKPEVLASVVTDCRYMNATNAIPVSDDPQNCPALKASYSYDIAESCLFQTQVVDEDVGERISISELPGCNALWTGNVSKPACPNGTIEGGNLVLANPSVWYDNEPYVS